MFDRARLRVAILFALLTGCLLLLVGGSITVAAVLQTRIQADLELQKRAEGVAAFGRGSRPLPEGAAPLRPPRADEPPPPGRPFESFPPVALTLPDPFNPRGPGTLDSQGIVTYLLPVRDGEAITGGLPDTIAGLPSEAEAARSLATSDGRFATLSLEQGNVRVFSLAVRRGEQTVGVVQVVRPRSFVEASMARLILILVVVGAAGLLGSTLAGYWLAGRTLRPVADAIARQRAFTSDASHELRTPLALIRGNAELLHAAGPLSVDQSGMVGEIVREADRLTRLVSDLLTLARADEGGTPVTRTRIDLASIAVAVVRQFEPLAAAKSIALRAEVRTPAVCLGDEDQLRQLLIILIDNAVRYTERGAVVVDVGTRTRAVRVAVSDTGPGIEPAHLDRLFDRFYRVDAARSSGGAGLGLAIAQWVAEAHGGRIRVASAVGSGTRFVVTLPAHAGHASARPAPVPPERAAEHLP